MPFKDELVINVKEGLLELTAEIVQPETDDPAELVEQVREHLANHQHELMTDANLMDSESVEVASVVMSRDPLPPSTREILTKLGLSSLETPTGGHEESSMFSILKRPKRSRLEKWRVGYVRAHNASEVLGELETFLVETIAEGPLAEIHDEATQLLLDGVQTIFRQTLTVSMDGLRTLETRLGRERGGPARLVLHPAFVRALAAFAGDVIIAGSASSRWEFDDEAPLYVDDGGVVVRTNPIVRAIGFVRDPRKNALSEYASTVIAQSRGG